MLFSSLNTGSTDFRDTEVQQPNTTATLSLVMSSRAFSANSGQFEAGVTITDSSFLPITCHTLADLETKSVDDLQDMAKELDISGYSRLKKQELAFRILQAQT